ncbi:MAG: helix-turn-helix transcriptional regulator [Coriobacteriaceae bacterium]|nr:helix-turn-helix transcriptional regulator [Coriobacteriaceae bacterium]
MGASYNKLFKLLIDRKMKKGELQRMSGISGTSIAKLGRGETVNTEILIKICRALKCDFGDIMEMEPESGDGDDRGI